MQVWQNILTCNRRLARFRKIPCNRDTKLRGHTQIGAEGVERHEAAHADEGGAVVEEVEERRQHLRVLVHNVRLYVK